MTQTVVVNGKTVTLPQGGEPVDVPADMLRAVNGLKPAIEAKADKDSAATLVTITIPAGSIPKGQKYTTSGSVDFTGFTARPVVVASFSGYGTGQFQWTLNTSEAWVDATKTLTVSVAAHALAAYSNPAQAVFTVALVVHKASTGTTFAANRMEYNEQTHADEPVRMSAPAAHTYHL